MWRSTFLAIVLAVASSILADDRVCFGENDLEIDPEACTDYSNLPKSSYFPHTVLIGYNAYGKLHWTVNGVLLNDQYVLTLGALSELAKKNELVVMLGVNDVNDRSATVVNATGYVTHSQYLSLLKLERPVRLGENILPICIYNGTDYENKSLTFVAWGGKPQRTYSPQVLHRTNLTYVPVDECQTILSAHGFPVRPKEEGQICARDPAKDDPSCRSGGGAGVLVRNPAAKCEFDLLALASFGPSNCDSSVVPNGYTLIYPYVDWIAENLKKG